MKRKAFLTIAGSDPSGGAGLQADLKTAAAFGLYGMSVVTAVTAQNTQGVKGVFDVPAEFIESQMDCVFSDIFPDAVKIGMLSRKETAAAAAKKLEEYRPAHVVVDPVMVSTSGHSLLDKEAAALLKEEIFPLAELITPNIPEAEALSGIKILKTEDPSDEEAKEELKRMEEAAFKISSSCGVCVLVKGGHHKDASSDVLFIPEENKTEWFHAPLVKAPKAHGTGCTLSSAIACGLGEGKDLKGSIKEAKRYLSAALAAGLSMGKGHSPVDHGVKWRQS